MVCKFANNGCDLYDPKLDAKTCEVNNGGPFMIHFVNGKLVISAYCGKHRTLSKEAPVVLVRA
jgi:hypothetical protein